MWQYSNDQAGGLQYTPCAMPWQSSRPKQALDLPHPPAHKATLAHWANAEWLAQPLPTAPIPSSPEFSGLRIMQQECQLSLGCAVCCCASRRINCCCCKHCSTLGRRQYAQHSAVAEQCDMRSLCCPHFQKQGATCAHNRHALDMQPPDRQ